MTEISAASAAGRRSALAGFWSVLRSEPSGLAALGVLASFLLVALLATWIAPYDPMERHFGPQGALRVLEPPSAAHWLGTTRYGRDVFSQLVLGTRVALLVGILTALFVVLIGTNVGLVSGYFGGRVDQVIMRSIDVLYGIPFLPFALILVAVLGPGIQNMIIAISLIMWRGTARVIRSQVLVIKKRTFIDAARVSGAGHLWVMYRHIAPNVIPMATVYMALAMGWGIMAEASLSFLGLGDPLMPTWGKMLFEVFNSQAMFVAWWWMWPPGIAITLLVLSGFLLGRSYEQLANPRLQE